MLAGRFAPGGKLFLLLNTLFSLGMGLSNLFVNIYFWQINAVLEQIALYNLVQFTAGPIAFSFAGWFSKSRDRLLSLQIGTVIYIVFFSLILLLRENALRYIIPLGLILGTGGGFFYLAVNVLIYDLTDNDSVDRFNGLNGFFVGMANMAAPFLAGWITSALPDLLGYRLIFALSLALFIIVVVISTKLWTRPLDHQFDLRRVVILPAYQKIMAASFLIGLRTGAFSFLIGLLVFLEGSEFVLGSFSLLMAGIGLASSYAGGRLINKHNRNLWAGVAAVLLLLAPLALSIEIALATLLVFGFLESVGHSLFGIPFQARTFAVIDGDAQAKTRRTEYLVAREIPLNIGRIISILILIALVPGDLAANAIRLFMLLLSPVSLFMWLSLRNAKIADR